MESSFWNFLFGLLSTVLSAAVGAFVAWIKFRRAKKGAAEKELAKRLNLIEHGQMLIMRSDLIRLHDIFTKRGYCPVSVKLSVREEYDGYHALGGNGVVTHMMEEITALPENPPAVNGGDGIED